ncbi:peptidoglycan-binding domain-containing protein [Streptomyces zingiberis]|uniref:Peptidoglycan-binding protein n=1 Tax=Streptomyces zingiberis TaxID=2053010 RepID=A0ABX1C071_9ACTN|nr:peptidoglycan-binding domain-containing protein [Streptomyces zingiberis]NJQ02038.1 peptidoglycan-binding protein [Streptomyces zingiberis]
MRRSVATALTAATLITGAVTAPAAFATTATTAGTTAQAYSCRYSVSEPYAYAGHYSGTTVVPGSTVVTTAGIEAQCLLKRAGFDPGTIDGVFGSNSRAAAKRFQTMMNTTYGYQLATDGIVGSATWPALRTYVCYRT